MILTGTLICLHDLDIDLANIVKSLTLLFEVHFIFPAFMELKISIKFAL